MLDLTLAFLFGCLSPLVVGAIALLRSFGAPSGKAPVAIGGVLLILAGLVSTGWEIYYRFVLLHNPLVPYLGLPPYFDPAVLYAVRIGFGVLVAAAVALFLVGVRSSRRLEGTGPGPRVQQGVPGPYRPQAPHPYPPEAPRP
ncbi:hypothetical protein NE857_32185 [Nocardiopsis exhalans]|uniref:Uncharacterized protein n=1 Tax=Nocardiopsis exhalans TaxID=163604 RepID=A0ABY5D7W3_9ACTN|nr:hypothetical protein [Nocardiopsis exhalans]USY19836.1 hypothetical protein NE857_32185 [Nocardiopsis exhalans]